MALPPRLLNQPRAVLDLVGDELLKARSHRDDSEGLIEGFGRASRYGHVCADPWPLPKKALLDWSQLILTFSVLSDFVMWSVGIALCYSFIVVEGLLLAQQYCEYVIKT